MKEKPYRIQIVEDDETMLELINGLVINIGHLVVGSSATGKDALLIVEENKPDIILMDINIEGEIDGIETAKEIKSLHNIPVVFVTGNYDDETIERAKQAEPMGFLIKPIDSQELKVTIEFAIFKHELQIEKQNLITELTDSFSNILRNYANSEKLDLNPHEWFR